MVHGGGIDVGLQVLIFGPLGQGRIVDEDVMEPVSRRHRAQTRRHRQPRHSEIRFHSTLPARRRRTRDCRGMRRLREDRVLAEHGGLPVSHEVRICREVVAATLGEYGVALPGGRGRVHARRAAL